MVNHAVIVVLLLAAVFCCHTEQHQILVNPVRGRDIPACLHVVSSPSPSGNKTSPRGCRTLQYVSKHFQNSSIELQGLIKFENTGNITLDGNGTRIKCSKALANHTHGGMEFSSVQDVVLKNIVLHNCGAGRDAYKFNAAIRFYNCRNVTIQEIRIAASNGVALAFDNTYGEVKVLQSLFADSGVKGEGNIFYAGGVYVEFTYCSLHHKEPNSQVESRYQFEACNFTDNKGYMYELISGGKPQDFRGFGLGGGLGITFNGNSCLNHVTISKCKFLRNNASWGGGFYAHFQNKPKDNSIVIENCEFTENNAVNAGGGADMGYIAFDFLPSFRNYIVFRNSNFTANTAVYGGGIAVYSSHSNATIGNPQHAIRFENCIWNHNSAFLSPAVDVSPFVVDPNIKGLLPVPLFKDCTFRENIVQAQLISGTKYNSAGSFLISEFKVTFGGHIEFTNHQHSALRISSGVAEFEPRTQALFFNNTGIQGGAIALYGASSLYVQNDSFFRFEQNEADVGGAIYHQPFDQHIYYSISTHSCLIHYAGPTKEAPQRNLTFQFINNNVSLAGKSVYSLSFRSCEIELFECRSKEKQLLKQFQCIGKFTFDQPLKHALATPGTKFNFGGDRNRTLRIIPGKAFYIPLTVTDELMNEVHTVYRLSTDNSNVKVDRKYIGNDHVTLFGNPGERTKLFFFTTSLRDASFQVEVQLLDCPPGYFFHKNSSSCICSAYHDNYAYQGITKCNNSLFKAYVVKGYWAGYLDSQLVTPDGLYTFPCPLGFCSYERHSTSKYLQLLPVEASKDNLDDLMCGSYRTGVLCGECKSGFSAYYHSRQYRCGDSNQCHLGLLFYFLSELLPLTVLFLTVIVFNISFTSGTANGFIFFSQVLDSLVVDANGRIQFPPAVEKLSIGYNIFYKMFNFDFFSIEPLSFCLWKHATVMDALAFRYVTVFIAFVLVISLVTAMRYCPCSHSSVLKKKIGLATENSVIHGLSAFLVICYIQCTRVTFQILVLAIPKGNRGHVGPPMTFIGGMHYFGRKHLLYAIPACICLVTIVTIPPLLLLVYPLYLHVLAVCGLSENKLINHIILSKYIPIVKLKPLLDSFQGCFKDRLRFFAGLYFLYRVAILAAYVFAKTTIHFYIFVEVILILMLGFHALAQPYEKRKHNVFDSLIFINLALINGFTIFAFVNHSDGEQESKMRFIFWLQVILIYWPIVYICAFIAAKLVKKITMYVRARREKASEYDCQALCRGDEPDRIIDHELLPYQQLEISALEDTQ